MKKLSSFFLISILLLSACQPPQTQTSAYYDLFDTYCRFTAYGLSSSEFETVSEKLHAFLLQFHQETDIYHAYDHMHNLYSINHAAGEKKLTVSDQLMDFLIFCQNAYTISKQRVNVMLGAVTALWHQGREQNTVPDLSSLNDANLHTQMSSLQLDTAENTVYISDSLASLDVGALAKGYAGRLAVAFLKQLGVENFLLDLGGNLCAYGSPAGREQFTIGLQDPSAEEGTYICTKQLQNQCAVTSGDYQRFYEVNGIKYHHIIDPDTLFPSSYHHSVTVIHEDSAMADLLSTALFLLSEEEGTALAESYEAVAIYLD